MGFGVLSLLVILVHLEEEVKEGFLSFFFLHLCLVLCFYILRCEEVLKNNDPGDLGRIPTP